MWSKNSFLALFTFIGTIVGGGIFGLPYVIERAGIIIGLIYILGLAGVALMIQLFFGEINLRTKEEHRLPGFTKKYLGEKQKKIVSLATITGLIGALLAYIIIGGDFLHIIISSIPGVNVSAFILSLIFAGFLSYFIYKGIESISQIETLINIGFFLIVSLIFIITFSDVSLSNFELLNLDNLFLPYGVILFSLMGWSAIPAMTSLLKTKEEKKSLKTIIITGIVLIVILYIFFSFSIVGVAGENTSEEALQGLMGVVNHKVILLGALFGVLAFASSFLVLGNYLKNVLVYDFSVPHISSFLIACGIPVFLFLIGFRRFIEVIGMVGAVLGVVEGAAIIFIFKEAKKLGNREPEYSLNIPNFILYFIIVILVIGIITQLVI